MKNSHTIVLSAIYYILYWVACGIVNVIANSQGIDMPYQREVALSIFAGSVLVVAFSVWLGDKAGDGDKTDMAEAWYMLVALIVSNFVVMGILFAVMNVEHIYAFTFGWFVLGNMLTSEYGQHLLRKEK